MARGNRMMMTFLMLLPAALAVEAAEDEIALMGYSPVSYFTEGRPELGSPRFAVRHGGKTYYLTSRDQQQRFRNEPADYIPAVAGHCPYSLALGRSVAVDPERFKIVDGRVFLFHNATELEALEALRDSLPRQAEVQEADRQFELFRF